MLGLSDIRQAVGDVIKACDKDTNLR